MEGLTFKDHSNKCNKDNCPKSSEQNTLYKAHVDYKPERDKNHMLAHNKPVSFFGNKTKGPKNIFIIRHGEKANGYGLDANGIYRATKLTNYIISLANKGYPISYIITNIPDPYVNGSGTMHPFQTMSASSFLLNIPIIMYSSASDYNTTAQELYNGNYNGLNILICWEHENIQGLCLSILNEGANQTPSRIAYANADDFFKNLTPSPLSGFYLCTSTSPNTNSSYIPPSQPQDYNNYANSQYYPYWNTNDFDSVYIFYSSISSNYQFGFTISKENIDTCFTNCNLHIGLYQPTSGDTNYYNKSNEIDKLCEPPTDWETT